jgi:phosphoglycerate dehydrogenase-like enzyme
MAPPIVFSECVRKVLLMENVHDIAASAFAGEGFTVVRHTKLSQEELEKELADTNIIDIRSKTMLPKETLDKVRSSSLDLTKAS